MSLAGFHSLEQLVLAFVLALTRVSSFVIASPILGHGTVPNSVKTGFCVALSVLWLPLFATELGTTTQLQSYAFACNLLNEFIFGVTLGFLVRLVFLPTRIAGSYIGQELGFNLGQVADPSTGSAANEVGILFDAFGLLLFWVTNSHHAVFRILGSPVPSSGNDGFIYGMANVAGTLLSDAHQLGLLIVAPLAAALFMVLVILSVLMRSWSHVTLFSFGMGTRLLIGLAAFLLLAPAIISNVESVFHGMAETIINALSKAS